MAKIRSFGILQTAKFAAVMYFVLSAIIVIPIGLISMIGGSVLGGEKGLFGTLFGGVFAFFIPAIYAAIGFVFVAIGCLAYNIIAKYAGGIEIEIEE